MDNMKDIILAISISGTAIGIITLAVLVATIAAPFIVGLILILIVHEVIKYNNRTKNTRPRSRRRNRK